MTTILLVDDHRILREGLRRILESEPGFQVVGEASDGEQAVKLASELRPNLVLMDISMPRLSGVDATRRICDGNPDVKVLVLSMHEDRACVEQVLRAGASGYVLKDASTVELFSAIEAVCSGDSYLSPSITQQVVSALSRPGERTPRADASLTNREREVLQLIAEGFSSKEIAEKLGLSLKTVESHRANLMEKLDIHKVSGLVRFAIRSGLVNP
jgi:DNA-binding NarL/FixJ family response regulator